MAINIYLSFDGQCEAAFNFYAHVLGAQITAQFRYADTPMEFPTPEEWKNKLMHASLTTPDGAILMGADAPPDHYKPAQGFSISLQIPDEAEAERVFAALSEGGTVTMPIAETFWAKRFGMLIDQFGKPWMINCEKPMPV